MDWRFAVGMLGSMNGSLPRLALVFVAAVATVARVQAAEPPDFERQIAPLLVNRCLTCHQPNKRSGGLDLSSRASLLTGGESGPALDAEKPRASLLLERVTAREMPPPDAKESQPLSVAEIELVQAWITGGASWPADRVLGIHERTVDLAAAREFWSFRPVVRPPVPQVKHADRVANPIDAFIWQQLEAAGLEMSPRAEPGDLLRRLSLDLHGLLPPVAGTLRVPSFADGWSSASD